MAQADGTILIDTEINADGMKAGSKEVETAVRNMAKSVENLGTKAKTALNKQVDAFTKLNAEYSAQQKKVDNLKKKVQEYGKQKIPTAEYKEIQNQIAQAEKKLNSLLNAQEKFIALGGKEDSQRYKSLQYDIDELANTIRYAEGELKDLEDTGKAFTLGSRTKESVADMQRLEAEMRKLSDMNNRLGTSYSSIKGQVEDYKNSLLKTNSAQKKTSASGNKVAKSLTNTAKASNKASFGIGKMLGTSILFSFVFQAINAALTALKDGFTNLAQYSSTTNNSISMLWSSLERLKNSLATAFAPILDVVAPILSKFIDMLSTAASYVSMFFSFLQGKDTYTRAVAVQKDYAASLQDTASAAGAAADEMERYLSPLDDLNKYTPANIGSGSGGGGSGNNAGNTGNTGPLFEEVAIDSKFSSVMDSIIEKLKQIKDIVASGFWDGLDDYKSVFAEIQSDAASISRSIRQIWSDPALQQAMTGFSRTALYNLGLIAGSVAQIGLTIAQNLIGGIESFLSENSGRVTNHLISIFNISSQVIELLGGLFDAVSDIFATVFGSQMAQDLTGNIIGIFAELAYGLTELALGIGRDLINFIVQPIIENKDAIAEALYQTLEPIESVAQSIETFIQNLVDKILSIYNEHIKPFIDALTQGISSIVGALLDAYNTYIAPVLDKLAAKFDEVLNGPVGNAINSFLDLIGKVFDAITELWNRAIAPLITWIVDNVVPVLAPIIETVGSLVLDLVGGIADAFAAVFDILGGVIDFVVGVFTLNWEKAWNGIKDIFSGIWNLLVTIIKTPINLIIGIINALIRGVCAGINAVIGLLNKIHITIPDWVPGLGGASFGFSLPTLTAPQIPYLASGAVIPPNREFLAVLGDQNQGNNIEAPEGLLRRIVREEAGNGNGLQRIEVPVYLNSRQIAKAVVDGAKMIRTQTGRNPLELV